MFLLVAATEMEIEPARQLLDGMPGVSFCLSGVGPVEAAMNLTKLLSNQAETIRGVVNFGVGGAYPAKGLELLDVCIAEKEVFGDLGICGETAIESLHPDLQINSEFPLANDFFTKVSGILDEKDITCQSGVFVTVSCTSGTLKRGIYMRDKHQAICENMEGASVARVCREYDLPLIELRSISNIVEDRDPSKWKLDEACQKAAETVAKAVSVLL